MHGSIRRGAHSGPLHRNEMRTASETRCRPVQLFAEWIDKRDDSDATGTSNRSTMLNISLPLCCGEGRRLQAEGRRRGITVDAEDPRVRDVGEEDFGAVPSAGSRVPLMSYASPRMRRGTQVRVSWVWTSPLRGLP